MIPNVVEPLDLYLDYWKQMMVLKLINSTFHLLRFLDATANSIETSSSNSNMGIAYTPTGIIVSPAAKVGSQKKLSIHLTQQREILTLLVLNYCFN
jgi:hypothetical protein